MQQASFGRFQLDLTNERLWQGKRAIFLRSNAFAVLRLLIESESDLRLRCVDNSRLLSSIQECKMNAILAWLQ